MHAECYLLSLSASVAEEVVVGEFNRVADDVSFFLQVMFFLGDDSHIGLCW